MKEIYQDGHVPTDNPPEREFEDISSKSKPTPPAVHPTRPKKHPTAPPMEAQQPPQQPAQQMPPMGYNPYYMPPYAPYPPQQPTAAPQAPTENGAAPAPYAPYPPYGYYPVYPPQSYAPPVDTTPPKMEVATGNDPGMRVLYQSADFDQASPAQDASYRPLDDMTAPKPTVIYSEDIPVEDIDLDAKVPKKTAAKKAPTPVGMEVDDMEMSAFELGAMAQKRRATSKEMKRPGSAASQQTSGASAGATSPEVGVEDFDPFPLYDPEESPEEEPEKKKVSTGEIIRRVVLCISVIAIIVALLMLYNEYRLSRENDRLQSEVSGDIIEEATTTKKSKDDSTKQTQADETTTKALTPEQQWEQIKNEYPNIVFPAGLQLKYAKLYAQNQDFVGYLSAEGVNLSLPVVQADDDDYYLKKNFYGKTTKYGCPFVTHLNNIDPLDQNTVIFGHHMNNGTVFGALDAYKTVDGFKKAPVITFNTLYKDYQWKVIAAFITNAEAKDDNDYIFRYYFTSLSTEDRFSAYLNELSQRSLYDTGVDVLPTDKLLTLSTCSHEFDEARFVVVARLVRQGESDSVDTSLATVNSNPRYPQAYYDKKGKTNPYKDASRWEVG